MSCGVYLQAYLDALISRKKEGMAESISKTALDFKEKYLDTFSFITHEIGLLFGNVQAGKTAQMFGIMCAAADSSFPMFILLTTDNIALQKQTYDRVVQDLSCCGFCICGESDKQKFVDNALAKPTIIVLKKNSRVLLQWYNTLAASSFVKGNALFIIDDEADAASPNTLVNKKRCSPINQRLNNIRNASIGSIYLQVTGTPQALLLQSSISDFRPAFTCYFEPGKEYLGGNFFFDSSDRKAIRFLDDPSAGVKDGLYQAILHHLAVSAQLKLNGINVCNFVVHPGVRKSAHNAMKSKIEGYMTEIVQKLGTPKVLDELYEMFKEINPAVYRRYDFEEVMECIQSAVRNNEIKILVMNGDNAIEDKDYCEGSNIIIGGNILGRGVTFPKLQTIYYTRTAKKPQADTMWQHSRMFGYDRDPGMMQVYITSELYKLFSNINTTNNSIISQISRGMEKIQIYYPDGLNATRKNVVDVKMVDFIAGGSNYFPSNPENTDITELTNLLHPFSSYDQSQVSTKLVLKILEYIIPSEDFEISAFKNVLKAKIAENPASQSVLIVRENRAVTQGTGSLLSPNDRLLGAQYSDRPVLTMYQISGSRGWKQENLWVPNIKLPDFVNYYNVQ